MPVARQRENIRTLNFCQTRTKNVASLHAGTKRQRDIDAAKHFRNLYTRPGTEVIGGRKEL